MLYGAATMLATISAIFAIDILFVARQRRATTAHVRLEEAAPEGASLPLESDPGRRPLVYPASAGAQATRTRLRKRALALVSVPVLLAIIGAIFLFSVRYYSGILIQASTVPAKAAQPSLLRPAFERGMIYPQWNSNGYGLQDTAWQQGAATIKNQTGAQWIEIPTLFSQATDSSTRVGVSPSAPSVQSFIEGIQRAHELGYKVFFVPLMQVNQPGGWSGSITFKAAAQEQAWYASYWHTLLPYVTAAANQHVEQMAIGTELQTLQQIVPGALWNQLITNIRGVFKNTLTYDMNWVSVGQTMPLWLKNPSLTYVGVSSYFPLVNTSIRVDPKAIVALWQQNIKTKLDALSTRLGKPVLISEIGYRNSADALYHTWLATSTAKADPAEQAGAYDAVLTNVLHDTHIAGTFFWGWDSVGMFAIKGQPAVQVLLKWYAHP